METLFKEILENYNVILITKFGSHLYGTASESSDHDFKGIYIPSVKDCIRGTVKNSINFNTNKTTSKNCSDDIDCEIYSLQYFLRLCSAGETAAIDMFHTNKESIIYSTEEWKRIQNYRAEFYSKNMKAFIGYAKKQAERYIVKTSKINAANSMLKVLLGFSETERLSSIWDYLPNEPDIKYSIEEINSKQIKKFTLAGKTIHETVTIGYATKIIDKILESYGSRSLKAVEQGADWKSLSHALRAAYELYEIYSLGDLVFPLRISGKLKEIKNGKCTLQESLDIIEEYITKVDELILESDYPEEINQEFVDWLLFSFYNL